jgi:hypothetical protein
MFCDVFNYRRIVIGNINTSNFHTINHRIFNRYRNYTTSIPYLNLIPQNQVVAYNKPTISGIYWIPVFNHKLGKIKELLNIEIHKKKIFKTLMLIGVPYVMARVIMKYI